MKAEKIRINKFLSMCGIGSRRECDNIISKGSIRVNGVIADKGQKVDPGTDKVYFKGKRIKYMKALEYFAYYKPRDVIVTKKDPRGRITIYDSLKKSGRNFEHLKYVGRLDRKSEGLILLTNDGDLIHKLTHPKYGIKKVYNIKTHSIIFDRDIKKMTEEGILSEGQLLKAGSVRKLDKEDVDGLWYEVVLFEGKNRQIRRMMEFFGYDVKRLKRIQFGVVKLRELQRCGIRKLLEREVTGLKRLGY